MNSVFKITSFENEKLEEYREKAMRELNEFFNKQWVNNTPKIIVVDDRKTINMLRNKESEAWLVGWSWGRHAVFILNPSNIKTESSHDYSEEQIAKLIKHELAHSYVKAFYGGSNFSWINEGISLYVANQLNRLKDGDTFSEFLDEKDVYREAGEAIKLLVTKFGKNKLFEFLKKQLNITDSTELAKIFKETYGFDLSYNFFNDLHNEAQKQ